MSKEPMVENQKIQTRSMSGQWFLSSYRYKFNDTRFEPFLEALKNKKLIGLKCQGCNTVSFPPKLVCGRCLVEPNRWVNLRETATIASFTIAYDKNEETGEVIGNPVVAIRQDGSDTTWSADLSPDISFDQCYIGMPLKVKWQDVTTGSLVDIEYYEALDDYAKDLPLLK